MTAPNPATLSRESGEGDGDPSSLSPYPDSPGWRREDLGGSPEHQPGPEGTTRPLDRPPTGSMLVAPERISRDLPESADQRLRSVRNCGRGTILVFSAPACRVLAFPARCKSWRCPTCRPYLINKWSSAIANAKPDRFVTLTCDPKIHATPAAAYNSMRRAFPKLVAALRRAGLVVEYCAAWELTKAGWPHLHVAQKGDYIPHAMLKKLWQKLRVGSIVDLRAITDHRGAARYIAKYMTKSDRSSEAGCRLHRHFQHSRHFFDDHGPQIDLVLPPCSQVVHVREHVSWCARILYATAAIDLVEARASGRVEFILHPAMCNEQAIAEYISGIP